jgi:hypothetical protein
MDSKFISNSKRFLNKNASTILTCAGALGVIATAVAAVMATPKAMRLIEKHEEEKGEKLTKLEVVKTAGPSYIPSILIGTSTIACIFGANVANKRQQATLVGLYSLLDSSYKEYKEKVNETFGPDAEEKIIKSIAGDHLSAEDLPELEEGKIRFMDFHSMQIFDSTMEDIKKAENLVNDILRMRGSVYLDEYLLALGLPGGMCQSDLGWDIQTLNENGIDNLRFDYEQIRLSNGDECYILALPTEPSWIN